MTENARLLDEAADKLLARHLPETALARSAPETASVLRESLLESGLHLALAPESAGGLDAAPADAATIAWRWGFHAAPLPIVGLLVGARAAALAGFPDEGAAVLGEADVPDFAGAAFYVLRRKAGGDALLQVDVSSGTVQRMLCGEAAWQAPAGGFAVIAARPLPGGAVAELEQLAALLTASQMAGLMAGLMERVIDHANTRLQFGRALGKFQAIQTLIADAASEQVLTQAALDAASVAAGRGDAAALLHCAKAQAGRAASLIAATAHQVLGAIGFTEEHVLGQYTRRLWDLRDRWGRQSDSEAALGRAAASDARGLWRHLVE